MAVVARTARSSRSLSEILQPLIFIVVAIGLPIVSDAMGQAGRDWLPLTTVAFCGIYAVFAVGLNVVVGYAGLLDLGYVAFFAIGAYTGGWLTSDFWHQINPKISILGGELPAIKDGIHLSFWFVLLAAVAMCALGGVIIGAPTLRLKSDYLALVTLGFGEIIGQIAVNGGDLPKTHWNITNGAFGIGPVDAINMTPFNIIPGIPDRVGTFDNGLRYYIITALLAILMFVSVRLRDGKLGRAWLAIREDELAASLMGVPLMKTKLWAYAVGAGFGGIGGAFSVATFGNIDPTQFRFQISVVILVTVVIGGMGNVYGVVLAAFLVEWLNYTGMGQITQLINNNLGTSIDLPTYEYGIFGLILVLMMLFKPDGLLPAARQKRMRKLDAALEQVGTEATP